MCEYCCEALINCHEEDAYGKDILVAERENFYGRYMDILNHITEKGTMTIAVNDHIDYVVLDEVKINYCPMCGAAIPNPTPTEIAHRKEE